MLKLKKSAKNIHIRIAYNRLTYPNFHKLKELVEKARAYEENDMHLELGMILGYPKCCCEFFKENFNENNYDL